MVTQYQRHCWQEIGIYGRKSEGIKTEIKILEIQVCKVPLILNQTDDSYLPIAQICGGLLISYSEITYLQWKILNMTGIDIGFF